MPATSSAQEQPATVNGGDSEEFRSLDEDIQDLKQEVLALNRDLFILEEELLFPANTQVAVFVSMDVGTFFSLDSVQIKLDDKEVSNYLYTERESKALLNGGVHRIYLGNLRTGKHELVAFFTGQGTHDRDYRRGTSLQFEKGVGAKFVELKISDRQRNLQPEFLIEEWE
ncbi:MAG: AraC family transcriptional regulator [Proteobacteria bacterium]|nr:AraC family transcriptional regulator [Pseudomonadota bacterium]